MYGVRGGWSATADTSSTNASTIGSIIAEWKACEVCRRTTRHAPLSEGAGQPLDVGADARQHCQVGRVDGGHRHGRPAPGPSPRRREAARRPSSRPACSASDRPRAATSLKASSSVTTPARHAADVLADAVADHRRGVTPQSIHRRARRVLDSEQRRLRDGGLLQRAGRHRVGRVRRIEDARAGRDPACGSQLVGARVDRVAEHRLARRRAPRPCRRTACPARGRGRRPAACACCSTRRPRSPRAVERVDGLGDAAGRRPRCGGGRTPCARAAV